MALCDEICALNIIELGQLSEQFREKTGLPDPGSMPMGGMMPMAMAPAAAAPAGGGGAADAVPEAAAEKEAWDVKLTAFDASSKIKVIKEVRAILGLGLKEAKEMVEGVPQKLKADIKKEEAEMLKEKIEAVGGTVEIE